MESDGQRRVVRKNDVVFIPPGTSHAIHNSGLGDLTFIVVTTPIDDKCGGDGSRGEGERQAAGKAGGACRDARARRHPVAGARRRAARGRSEEHTSDLQSLMRSSYAAFCLK